MKTLMILTVIAAMSYMAAHTAHSVKSQIETAQTEHQAELAKQLAQIE